MNQFLRNNQKTLGIFGFLVLLASVTAAIEPSFMGEGNVTNMVRYTGLYGIISLGVAFVIITGGIDLSVGSLIGLTGVLLPKLIIESDWSVGAAMMVVMALSLGVGLIHGLLITKLRLQPFLVTLCGLFIYRGFARYVGGDRTLGFGNEYQGLRQALVKTPVLGVPMAFWVLVILAIGFALFLNKTVWGRYMLALGRNEEAARFSGINTQRMTIVSYMICSGLAGFGGMMFILENNSATGSNLGNFHELYAIAGAVLGGCSLRGGEGAVAGVILGAALVQVVENAVFFLEAPDTLKYAVLGFFILFGVILDEILNRVAARRRALKAAG